jgi:hypothetical protein
MLLVAERQEPEMPSQSPRVALAETILLGKTTPTTSSPSNPLANQQPVQPPFVNQEIAHRAAWKAGVLGAVNVFAMILGARLLVLVAIAGAIWLTWTGLGNPDLFRLIALGTYCVAVVVPVVWLASQGR